MGEDEGGTSSFSVEVGRRLRSIRKARQLSLDDVERVSAGRWSASAVGAYERGFRNLSLPRLRDLAAFYGVPMGVLLGEREADGPGPGPSGKIVLDLEKLKTLEDDEATSVSRYVQSIILERGDYNGRVLTVRRDDLRALCAITRCDEPGLFERLRQWGVLLSSPERHANT